MQINFSKYQGIGNHFVIVSSECGYQSDHAEIKWSELSKKISNPNFGIGCDGLMVVCKRNIDLSIPVLMFNPDGSLMGMCGNGIRCVMKYCYDNQIIKDSENNVSFIVESRIINCKSMNQGKTVEVDLGYYTFEPNKVPILSETEQFDHALEVLGEIVNISAVSVGNPHCVIVSEDEPREEILRALEVHKNFPKRTNVEFVKVLSRDTIKVIVWERGAGRTLACGTGAAAASIVVNRLNLCDGTIKVILPGGELFISVDSEHGTVSLNGPAELVFRGELIL